MKKIELQTQKNVVSKKMSPPLIKTWLNGVYNFNQSLIKNIPSADNIVYKLIKSYFFMNPLWQNFDRNKSRLLVRRFRRASLNRIAVSKPEIKHSSDKVFINVYIFNKKKNTYLYKLNHIYKNVKNTNLQTLLKDTTSGLLPTSSGKDKNKTSLAPSILNKFIENSLSQKKSLETSLWEKPLAVKHSSTSDTDNLRANKILSLPDLHPSVVKGIKINKAGILDSAPFEAEQNIQTSNKDYNSLRSYIVRTKKGVSNTLDVLSYGLKKSHPETNNIIISSSLKYKTKAFNASPKWMASKKKILHGATNVMAKNPLTQGFRLHTFYKGGINLKRFLLSERNRRLGLTITKENKIYNAPFILNDKSVKTQVYAGAPNNLNLKILISSSSLAKTTLRLNVYKNLELYNKYKYQIFKLIQPNLVLKQTQHFMKSNIFKLLNKYKALDNYKLEQAIAPLGLQSSAFNVKQKYNNLKTLNRRGDMISTAPKSCRLTPNFTNKGLYPVQEGIVLKTTKFNSANVNMPLKSLSALFKELSLANALEFKNKALLASTLNANKISACVKNLNSLNNKDLLFNNTNRMTSARTYKLLNKSYYSKLNLIKSLMFKFNIITNRPLYINKKDEKKVILFYKKTLKGKRYLLKNRNRINRLKARFIFVKSLLPMGVRSLSQTYLPTKSVNPVTWNDLNQNKLNTINSYLYMCNAFNKLDRFFNKYNNNLLASSIVSSDSTKMENAKLYKAKTLNLTYKKKIVNQILNLETSYIHYLTLLEFNNSLFKNWFINPLCNIISRIYNKKVIFNVVSLKAMYFNSDILSNLIAIRLNNHKKNRYNKVFKKALRAVALAKVNEHSYNSQSDIYKSLNKHYQNYNNLNHIIGLIPNNSGNNILVKNTGAGEKYGNVLNAKNSQGTVLKRLNASIVNTINFIKHKSVFGIRLEASGRLTKRSTASRKIFKFRYLGNLRLNDIINRKVSGVMVKDKITNNLQFSKVSSKTRNGAFGIKGWINQA